MRKNNQQSSRLVSQADVHEKGEIWHRRVLTEIEDRLIGDRTFPCIFSKNSARKGLLRFVFVSTVDSTGISDLVEGLAEYVNLSRNWNQNLNTAYPLIVAFSLAVIEAQTLERYHAFGWQVLQRVHELDPSPWPSNVGKSANDASWSMCFHGMSLFCNMSHPGHRLRRSRNLGDHLLIVINPRERFDAVAGNTDAGRRTRALIRGRIDLYDEVEHYPFLATYGGGKPEWRQYGLPSDNVDTTDKCPFRFAHPLAD